MSHHLLLLPQYLPSIAYFLHAYHAKEVTLDLTLQYKKDWHTNRTTIKMANKLHYLTVPIQHATTKKKNQYSKVKISYSQDWIKKHLRTLATAYNRKPYFNALAEKLFPILESTPIYLGELQAALLKALFDFIGMEKRITTHSPLASSTEHHPEPCSKQPLPPQVAAEIERLRPHQTTRLSIVDLLAREGPYIHHILATPPI